MSDQIWVAICDPSNEMPLLSSTGTKVIQTDKPYIMLQSCRLIKMYKNLQTMLQNIAKLKLSKEAFNSQLSFLLNKSKIIQTLERYWHRLKRKETISVSAMKGLLQDLKESGVDLSLKLTNFYFHRLNFNKIMFD